MFIMTRKGVKRARSASEEFRIEASRRRNQMRRMQTADPEHFREHMSRLDSYATDITNRSACAKDHCSANSTENGAQILELKGQLVHEFEPTTKFDSHQVAIASITFSAQGDLCISDTANKKLKIFDRNGQLKVECTVQSNYGSFKTPCGVGVLGSGNIVATDKADHTLKIFTPVGQLLNSVKLGNSTPGRLCVFGNENSNVAVIDEDNKSIIVVSDPTKPVMTRLSGGVQDNNTLGSAFDVTSVTVMNRTMMAISDDVGHKLTLLDPETNTRNDINVNVGLPKGLCSLPNGKLLVADCRENTVMQIHGAELTSSEVLLGPEQGLQRPLLVAANTNGGLAVVEADRRRIKLFR